LEFEHLEIDTVVGKRNGRESVALTLIERMIRFEIMKLTDGRDTDSVNYAMDEVIKFYGDTIESITVDNGSEFTNLENIISGTCDAYFVHTYLASVALMRGHNRMIRCDLFKEPSLYIVSPQLISLIHV
jgi:IS30 family transposase